MGGWTPSTWAMITFTKSISHVLRFLLKKITRTNNIYVMTPEQITLKNLLTNQFYDIVGKATASGAGILHWQLFESQLFQLLANAPGQAVESEPRFLHLCGKLRRGFCIQASEGPISGHCGHLGIKQQMQKYLSLSISLSYFLHFLHILSVTLSNEWINLFCNLLIFSHIKDVIISD